MTHSIVNLTSTAFLVFPTCITLSSDWCSFPFIFLTVVFHRIDRPFVRSSNCVCSASLFHSRWQRRRPTTQLLHCMCATSDWLYTVNHVTGTVSSRNTVVFPGVIKAHFMQKRKRSPAVARIANRTGCQWPSRSSKVNDSYLILQIACVAWWCNGNGPNWWPKGLSIDSKPGHWSLSPSSIIF